MLNLILRQFRDEEQTEVSRSLTIIVCLLLSASLLLLGGLIALPQFSGRWELLLAVIYGVCILSLVLNRRGYTRLAGLSLIVGLWVILTVAALTAGGIASFAALFYLMIVFIAGLLLGSRAAIATALLCILTALGLVVVEMTGHLPSHVIPHTPWSRWISITLLTVIIMGLQYLSVRRVHDALTRSRQEVEVRRRAEDELRKSEAEARLAADAAGLGTWFWDEASNELTFDRAANALFGLPAEKKLTIEEFFALLHVEDRDEVYRVWREAVDRGTEYQSDYRTHWPDGSIHWITARGRFYHDETESLPKMVGIVLDITGRKQREEQLRRTSERLELATRAARIGIWDWSVARDELVWDDAMYRLFGIRKEDFSGAYDALANYVAPEDVERVSHEVQAALRGEREFASEFRIVWPDASVHFIKAASETFRDENGRPVRMVGINYDITERKRAEIENRKLIHHLGERVKELTALHRAARILENETMSVTQLLQEILALLPPAWQYPEVTAGRISFGALICETPNFTATQWSQMVEFTAGGVRGTLEVVYLEERPAQDLGPFLWEEKNLISSLAEMISSALNHRSAQEALRESERRFSDTLTNIEMIAIMADIGGNITFCNDYLLRLTDWKREEAIGRNWYEMFLPEDEKEKVSKILDGVEPTGEVTIHLENEIKTRSGERRLVNWTNTTLRGMDGEVIGIAAFGDDITERKQAEEQLKASSDQLRALSERLRRAKEEEGIRIARELHDELGSTLTSLKWSLLELDKAYSGNQQQVGNSSVRVKIEGMVDLVDATVNTVRRISSELRPGVLDDLGLVSAIEWHSQQFQEQTGIVCRFDSTAEIVELDREQATTVFRIFQEAMTNILRHSQASKVNIVIDDDESEFVLEIRDNGRGITESECLGIRSLGLLGMRERAHSISGEVEINGIAGKGTILIARFPVRSELASERSSPASPH